MFLKQTPPDINKKPQGLWGLLLPRDPNSPKGAGWEGRGGGKLQTLGPNVGIICILEPLYNI